MTSTMQRLYPYRLEPLEKPAIWGGSALVDRYGKAADPHAAIGESWECWDENRVDNGSLRGATLADLRRDLGAELMGPLDSGRIFPLLTKIIDARQALSVQVHPDDAYARRVEGQPNGKTECWYILAAEPEAELVLGWTRDTDRTEYERRVADGSLGEILRRVPVRPGEVYYVPAGSLHAIGAGIQLFETQQASDLTYRIFDWNRIGSDGRPRELHVQKAADVLDFRAGRRGAVTPLRFADAGVDRTLLVADLNFALEHIATHPGGTIDTDGRPLTITALGLPLIVEVAGVRTEVPPYATIVVPAAAERIVLHVAAQMLVARPAAQWQRLRAGALRGGASEAAIDAFFAQFV